MTADSQAATACPAWKALETHYQQIRDVHLRTLFAQDPDRGERLTLDAAGSDHLQQFVPGFDE